MDEIYDGERRGWRKERERDRLWREKGRRYKGKEVGFYVEDEMGVWWRRKLKGGVD